MLPSQSWVIEKWLQPFLKKLSLLKYLNRFWDLYTVFWQIQIMTVMTEYWNTAKNINLHFKKIIIKTYKKKPTNRWEAKRHGTRI